MPRQSARINKNIETATAESIPNNAQTLADTATRGRKRRATGAHTRASKRLKQESVSPPPEDVVQDPAEVVEDENVEPQNQDHHVTEPVPAPQPDNAPQPESISNANVEVHIEERVSQEAPAQKDSNALDDSGGASSFDQELADAAVQKAAEAAARFALMRESSNAPIENGITGNSLPGIAPIRSGWDPSRALKLNNLPILGQLSSQIVSHLSDCRLDQIDQACQDTSSEHGRLWGQIRRLFEISKQVFAEDTKFLDATFLDFREEHERLNIRRANIATAVANIVCNDDRNFLSSIHDTFLETFVPQGSQLSQWQSELLLQLKTQAYIRCLVGAEVDRHKLTEHFFSSNLEVQLKRRHPDLPLSDAETHFLRDAWNKGDELTSLDVDTMTQKFRPEDFRASVYLRLKNVIEDFFVEKPPAVQASVEVPDEPLAPETNNMAMPLESDWMSSAQDFSFDGDGFDQNEMVRRAAMAAHAALRDVGTNNMNQEISNTISNASQNPHAQVAHSHNLSYTQQHSPYGQNSSSGPNASILEDSETSTRALYEKARQAATAKASSKSRGTTGTPSQRRPWNAEEENALMTGLDMVKGPHWSQILAMFGAGGTVSEVLKDRNQVQLKDKARNLKLFFLKSGNEVPNYLQHVTGELKTRAPNQAAKHEARDRLRDSTTEDKATVDAINVLASGGRQSSGLDTGDEIAPLDTSDMSTTQQDQDGEEDEALEENARTRQDYNLERDANQLGSDQMVRAALSEALHNPRSF